MNDAQLIYNEAEEALGVLENLIEDDILPSVEASDFKTALEHIRSLSVRLGATRE